MTQQIINIGAAPNDGEGDNLRTAFDKVNDNFSNVWAQGPVDSNVRIQGNTISTLQVNQDLALSPNGTGNIRLNNNTIPGANNTWFLGSTTNRWRGLYVGNVTANNLSVSGIVDLSGDVTVGGNLTVVGNTIQIGNITTDTKTIQLANTATTDSAANSAGVTVGANDDIATLLYESGNNVWTTNIGLQVGGPVTGTSLAVSSATVYGNIAAINGNFTGNVAANYFIGNGSQLTGMYGNANVVTLMANFGSNVISTTGNITGSYILGNGSQLTGINTGATISNTAPTMTAGGIWWNSVDGRAYVKYGNIFIDLSPSLVPDPTTYVGNVSFDDITVTNVGNIIPAGNNAYSLGSEAFQWKDLWVSNNTIYINSVPITLSADNVLTVDGNAVLSNDSDTSITTTGNITADYFFGNGSQLTGISSSSDALVNGDNSFVLDADGNVVFEGEGPGDGVNRGMVWDYGAVANGVNSMVRQDNNGITVRAWTENAGDYAAPVNIVTNQDANTKTWIFDGQGDLTLAGNIQSVNTGFAFSGTITGIESFAYPTPPVITIAEEVFEGPITGQVTIFNLNPSTGTPQANGTWYYEAVDPNQFTLYTDAELTEPANTSSWTAYLGPGGDAVSLGGYTDLTIQGGNVTVGSNNNTWTFGNDGNLTLPQGGVVYETSIPGGALTGNTIALKPSGGIDADQQLLIYPTAGPVTDDNHLHLTTGNLYNTELYLGDDYLYVKLANTGNVVVNSNDAAGNTAQWTFGTTGNLTVPGAIVSVNNVDLYAGDAATITSNNTGTTNTWTFDETGNLTLPAGTIIDDVSTAGVTLKVRTAPDTIDITGADFTPVNLTYTRDFGQATPTWYPADYTPGSDPYIEFSGGEYGIFNPGFGQALYINTGTFNNPLAQWNINPPLGSVPPTGEYTYSGSGSSWTFDTIGNLTTPQGMVISGNVNFLNTDTALINPADNTPLSLFSSGANGTVTSFWTDDIGNLMTSNIAAFYLPLQGTQTVRIVNGNNGGNIAIYDFGNDGVFTTANITATYAYGDTTEANVFVGGTANISGNITAGNVVMSGGIVGSGASPAPYLSGFSSVSAINISASANISASGNVSGNYILGNGAFLTGVATSYGNANVATFLAAYGSNTISTTGNITAGNLIGNISITGNVQGTSANVTLVAGSYSTTFDNAGNVIFANSNVFVGTTSTALPNTIASFSSNINSYTQVTNQNRSTGADATADYILTANNGSDSVNYGDFGIINSGYDNATPTNSLGNIVFAADTYVYAAGNVSNTSQSGGNLAIGTITSGKTVKIFAGGNTASAQVANISSTGVAVTGNVVTSNQLQSSTFSGGNILWTVANQTDFQGAIKVGTNIIKSSGGAQSIVLNNNGANIPILGVTNTGVSTSTTTGALIVSGGAGVAGNVYVGGLGNITGNLTVNGTAGVSTPNLPAFRVVGTVNTSWGPDITITSTQGAAIDYNQGSYYNNTTGTFTAPVAGLYQVNMSCRNAGNTTSYSQMVVAKNVATTNVVQCMVEFAANSTMNHAGVSTVSKLAVGDTLNLRVLTGTIQFDANDTWSVAYLG